MSRIGVFICHCGHNIAGTVDVAAVAGQAREQSGVAFVTDYKYMCSEPGQQLIRESIGQHHLDGVVVAACSPAMHEATFQRTAASAGLNPYRCESANIREQVAWVHKHDPVAATYKAQQIIRAMVEKVKGNEALTPFKLPVTRRALVIGGGIAGLQAALDLAEAGYPVILVERAAQLGGKMAQLCGGYLPDRGFDSEVPPRGGLGGPAQVQSPEVPPCGGLGGPAQVRSTPRVVPTGTTCKVVLPAGGYRGVQRKIERVTHHPCIQVLTEAEVETVSGYVGNFQVGVKLAQPSKSPSGENDPSPNHELTFEVGAIVVATGWERYPLALLPEYGGAALPDVVDSLTFERMLASKTAIRRPSDGRVAREVVFVQCAGSRDPAHGVSYCSKVCCMVTAKQAMLYRQRAPDGQAYVFYIDIRSAGKGYDEYVQRAMADYQVLYLRGKVSKIFQEGGQLMVWGADTLSGRAVEIAADLVVLATPMLPSPGAVALGQRLRISADAHGFFNEAHPKLRPVETLTAGVFVAGASQGPKDIPETVAQASGAAAKVLQLFSQEVMTQSPLTATVIEELCAACGACVSACPYGAREIHPVWHIATVNPALCQSCGACVSACPNKASQVYNWRPKQVLAMVDEVVT